MSVYGYILAADHQDIAGLQVRVLGAREVGRGELADFCLTSFI